MKNITQKNIKIIIKFLVTSYFIVNNANKQELKMNYKFKCMSKIFKKKKKENNPYVMDSLLRICCIQKQNIFYVSKVNSIIKQKIIILMM